ncbi:MAG: hypothetical protein MJ000_11610 [Bacteroidales bacterium]|nr:hypothetical protein [Bacteroidales bacterium]
MNAKTYLQQIRKVDELIDCKQKELESLCQIRLVSSSEKIHEKIEFLQDSIDNHVDQLIDLRTEVMQKIEQLDAPYVALLYKRYFEFKTWEEIADEMNYSQQWVWLTHGEALKRLERILDAPDDRI